MGHPQEQAQQLGGRPPRFRLYIDESGDHVFRDPIALQEIPHRFLALCGCFFATDDYVVFHDAWEALKRKHFPHSPDEPIIMHRSDIVNRKGPFWRLRDQEVRQAFDDDLLSVVDAARFRVVMVAIDKLRLSTGYARPFHPYHAALGFMLQRYCGYLNHLNRRGDVLAEGRGRAEDQLLRNAYQHIYVHGDMFHKADFYRRGLTSHELKVKKKPANIAGLQLADILAYPLRKAVLAEQGFTDPESASFGARLAALAESKYNRHLYDGRVEGYGKVLFPR